MFNNLNHTYFCQYLLKNYCHITFENFFLDQYFIVSEAPRVNVRTSIKQIIHLLISRRLQWFINRWCLELKGQFNLWIHKNSYFYCLIVFAIKQSQACYCCATYGYIYPCIYIIYNKRRRKKGKKIFVLVPVLSKSFYLVKRNKNGIVW